jgi:hypothetical protein
MVLLAKSDFGRLWNRLIREHNLIFFECFRLFEGGCLVVGIRVGVQQTFLWSPRQIMRLSARFAKWLFRPSRRFGRVRLAALMRSPSQGRRWP